jgi:surfactin synthase thioesterase subunit
VVSKTPTCRSPADAPECTGTGRHGQAQTTRGGRFGEGRDGALAELLRYDSLTHARRAVTVEIGSRGLTDGYGVTAIGQQTVTESARWFGRTRRQPESACILFCLPYSGSGASIYHGWRHLLDPRVEVTPIRLPGREDRIGEPPSHSAEAIAAVVAARADRPYAIYGHSMGARLGFEVIRALRRQGVRLPFRFYPAACLPPDIAWPFTRCVDLPDGDFLNALAEHLNAPAEAWTIPELRELVLPVLRADFTWIARYQYQAEPPLAVPLVGLAGADDPEAGPSSMLGWSRHTSVSFRLHTLPGDHFFLRSAAAEVTSLLSADMLRAIGAGAR